MMMMMTTVGPSEHLAAYRVRDSYGTGWGNRYVTLTSRPVSRMSRDYEPTLPGPLCRAFTRVRAMAGARRGEGGDLVPAAPYRVTAETSCERRPRSAPDGSPAAMFQGHGI